MKYGRKNGTLEKPVALAQGALDVLAYMFGVAMFAHMLSVAWDAQRHAGDDLHRQGPVKFEGIWQGPVLASQPLQTSHLVTARDAKRQPPAESFKGPSGLTSKPSPAGEMESFSILLNGSVVTGKIASSLVGGGPATRRGFNLTNLLDRNEDSSWEMVWDTALGAEFFPRSNFSSGAALLSLAFDKPVLMRTVEVHWGGGTWVPNVKARLRGRRSRSMDVQQGMPDVAKAVRIRIDGE
eukprot:CAMPEP_0197628116 /NCGR_PEP_ID=MMETSP1338-20131121/6535_1 /TAXON_ID=43686 ORGANISM="Pelagodinium beii, Strain RCC1491" /NCGR_SAMPLE_ID=MMETSP1338 /ASSEMBLY_ACC=CAM_ASM_000754 /LENGTH=237 /DNA_ID=CAMNT_0043199025 /DNA_START=51 /DNA_END=761 /DNA_ORIENTATION=+